MAEYERGIPWSSPEAIWISLKQLHIPSPPPSTDTQSDSVALESTVCFAWCTQSLVLLNNTRCDIKSWECWRSQGAPWIALMLLGLHSLFRALFLGADRLCKEHAFSLYCWRTETEAGLGRPGGERPFECLLPDGAGHCQLLFTSLTWEDRSCFFQ